MSRKGKCWDNAAAESLFGTLKLELEVKNWATREEAKFEVVEYLAVFYNRERLHSTLGYMSPEAFETMTTAKAAV